MRVALQTDQVGFPAPGGIGTYIRELGAELARTSDVDLRLFHARIEGWREEPWMAGRAIAEIPRAVRSLYPSWDLLGWPRLPAAVDLAEVVHVTNPVGIPGRRTRGKALVVTVHDLAFLHHPRAFPPAWRRLYRLGLRAAARRADVILVPSRSTMDDIVERAGVAPDRVVVTPLAAARPGAATAPPGLPEDVDRIAGVTFPERYVLAVGTIEPRKNLVRLIRGYRRAVAAHALPHALVLAGPPGWRSDEVLAEVRPGEPGRVLIAGALSASDLERAYAGADLVAYPSLHEGFGLPILEAMQRGVPVVASSTSSIPEVAGDAAVLVDPRSADLIGDAIARVLVDGALAARLREAGRERAASFTWEATARSTVEAYRRALA